MLIIDILRIRKGRKRNSLYNSTAITH